MRSLIIEVIYMIKKRSVLLIMLFCLMTLSFSSCFLNAKIYPLSDEEVHLFKNLIDDYADLHNYTVEFDDLSTVETHTFAKDRKYSDSELRDETALHGVIRVKDNAYVDVALFQNKSFSFDINGINDENLIIFADDFTKTFNSFSKYEVKSSDLESLFNSKNFKKGEFVTHLDIDFFGNASLDYEKSTKNEDGEYIPPRLHISNVLDIKQ